MEQRVSLITLGVADLDRAVDFYGGLGWEPGNDRVEQGVAFFQAAGMVVALWDRAKLAADSEVSDDAGGWGGITLAYNVRSPADVERVLAEAENAGGTVPRAGVETEWGGYSGLFADPDGHRWEVAHNPAWELAEDGSVQLP